MPIFRDPVLKFSSSFFVRFHWLNLPGALLLALLQRTPAVRVVATASEMLTASPAAQLLRSTVTAAVLGAVHTLAGATTLVAVQGTKEIIRVSSDPRDPVVRNPVVGEVGKPITPVAFTYIGTFTATYYAVSGPLPAGLSFNPPVSNRIVIVPPSIPAVTITGTPLVSGNFTVFIQGFDNGGGGTPEPIDFVISGSTSATIPAFTVQPASQTVSAGTSVTFTANANGSPTPTFQWRRNGTSLAGATAASLTLPSALPSDAGDYTVVASNSAGSTTSAVARLTVNAAPIASRLSNLSVRTTMLAGQTLIVGVVVDGGSRDVLVRAAGPALAAFGLANAMIDPRLELYNGPTKVFENDNWPLTLSPTFTEVGAFPFAAGSLDAAFVRGIDGARSIWALGTGPGAVLVEAYDTGSGNSPRMVNVSARNRVGTGDDILIAGFNIAGTGPKQLLVRAIGPGLAAFGVPGTLVDPVLEIYTGSGIKVAENDNWSADLAPTFAAVGAFALPAGSRDAALLTTLLPGGYTVQVRGAGGGTGEGLIEIYEIR